MKTNLDVIRAMFRSLNAGVRNARGKKIYKFSELRDLLTKENVTRGELLKQSHCCQRPQIPDGYRRCCAIS